MMQRTVSLMGGVFALVGPAMGLTAAERMDGRIAFHDLTALTGANVFHDAGYTGSGVVIGNIEAGHVAGGHPGIGTVGRLMGVQGGEASWHATAVASTMVGTGDGRGASAGLSTGAELWSGAIATRTHADGAFSTGFGSFADAYGDMLVSGASGRTADVINSSWSTAGNSRTTQQMQRVLDAMAHDSGATVVFTAGNEGRGSVNPMAGGFNTLSVGALASNGGSFDRVASFSSTGWASVRDLRTGQMVHQARAGVDLVAPGQGIRIASTNSQTGYAGASGTSFAAPIVSSGAALLNDVARDRFGSAESRDARTIKAVLMNSARKIPSWSNRQHVDEHGVIRTTQALDLRSGAGALDLAAAFDQFTAGTTDVAGTGGGAIDTIGWDFGVLDHTAGAQDYVVNTAVEAGSQVTVTLGWFAEFALSGAAGVGGDRFADLALEVWSAEDGAASELLAISDGVYNTTEHLSFAVEEATDLLFRVRLEDELWDLTGRDSDTEFALAWSIINGSQAVPTPGAIAMLMVAGAMSVRRKR